VHRSVKKAICDNGEVSFQIYKEKHNSGIKFICVDISDKKKNYLLQVMPPSDVLTEIIRSIVTYNNITNAAILYDETFVVDHKYKALLQNIPTRHVITAIAGEKDRAEQLVKLRNLDINNYFILGTLESIKKVLGEF
jgi:glutamate receptor, ionotropic, invertebrate